MRRYQKLRKPINHNRTKVFKVKKFFKSEIPIYYSTVILTILPGNNKVSLEFIVKSLTKFLFQRIIDNPVQRSNIIGRLVVQYIMTYLVRFIGPPNKFQGKLFTTLTQKIEQDLLPLMLRFPEFSIKVHCSAVRCIKLTLK